MQRRTLRAALAAMGCTATAVAVMAAAPTALATTADTGSWQSVDTASQPQYDGIIVGYKDGAPEDTSLTAAGGDVAAKAKASGLKASLQRRVATGAVHVAIDGQNQTRLNALMKAYRADASVAYVEPNLIMHAMTNDTEYNRQWDLFEATGGMRVDTAWELGTGQGVTVAVIDTGLVAHSDLAGQTVAGYDFISSATTAGDGNGRDADASDPGDASTCQGQVTTSSWHGTHVAGTIAAATNNNKGIAGIAYGAKVQPVRVLGKCGGTTADIADAIIWASGGTVSGVPANPTPAKVLNLSLGGQSPFGCGSTTQNAINGAVGRGTTVVVAAGNSNVNVSGFTPANCNNVVAVAATSRAGDRAFYSNFGNLIDVSAPGGQTRNASDPAGTITTPENGIWSTLNAGNTTPTTENYEPYMGTSMAAPHVAGLAALMVGKSAALTPAQVESAMKTNARALPGSCSGGCGAGIVDARRTMEAIGGTNPSTVTVTNPGSRTSTVGTAVSVATGASGGAAPYTFSATGLPAGLSINSSTGSITGTPTTAGTTSVTVTAQDSSNPRKSGTATFSWTVSPSGGGTGLCAGRRLVQSGTAGSGQQVALAPFTDTAAGTIRACLDGPNGTDFDLYLQRQSTSGTWSTVASGLSSAPDEQVTYSNAAGTYRLVVRAYSGSGSFTTGVDY